ncbi:MAG: gluconokinase [Alphaproteobacteria bacterium]|nr:gluconokinase [Alphaproteobacteria bacterium]
MQSQRKTSGLPRCAIVVMGVSGSGKSTLIADLAAQLDCPAYEGDSFHAAASIAKMRAGQPLDDSDRWPWLDRLGFAIGASVRGGGLALAACSALKRRYRERLEAAAAVPLLFVMLDGEKDEIALRLAARESHYMPASLLDSQCALLERPAADERALVLHCYGPIEDLRSHVLAWAQAGLAAAAG